MSRAVASIEETIGLRLFQRTTRSLKITEEGETYLRRIAPLLEELDAALEEAGATRHTPAGTLKMTASVAFSHECIVPNLGAFQARYPDVSVELHPAM